MATQNPLIPSGQWVQYNVAVQSPRAALPTTAEKTIGVIRQSFTAFDGPYYVVVWNPGSAKPETGMYHQNELTVLTPDQANKIQSELAQGTFTPTSGTPGSQYQQPNIPVQAAPAFYQQTGMETL